MESEGPSIVATLEEEAVYGMDFRQSEKVLHSTDIHVVPMLEKKWRMQPRGRTTCHPSWIASLVCCEGCARVRPSSEERSYRLGKLIGVLDVMRHKSPLIDERFVAQIVAMPQET